MAVSDGGTGATTLDNLITMGTHTSGDFVGTITGGDGIASSAGTTGEDTDHTLSIDAKTNGGLVIESNKLAVKLDATSITGILARGDGGTGRTDYSMGDILYGATSGATLNKLSPAGSNADVGKFLKLGSGDEPVWASVSSTTMGTTNQESSADDHGLIFVANAGTGAQALLKDSDGSSFGTLKYKPSTGTLTTSNVITSDTSIDARNGIANTTPTHTLDIGSNVSVIDAGVDKLVIEGNVYSTHDIISLGTIHSDIIKSRDIFCKTRTIVAERPSRQIRLN